MNLTRRGFFGRMVGGIVGVAASKAVVCTKPEPKPVASPEDQHPDYQAEQRFIDLLEDLHRKGIPIPIRTWASASGIDLDKILKG